MTEIYMRNASHLLIDSRMPIRKVIEIIDNGKLGIAIVVDKNRKLKGIVTDVDVRKGLVRGCGLDESAGKIMKSDPVVANITDSRQNIYAMMQEKAIRQIPIIDDNRQIAGIEIINDFFEKNRKLGNKAVIMAGGMGKRLMPLTESIPKPLLHVGGKPLLETALSILQEHQLHHVYIMVNYLSEKIEGYVKSLNLDLNIKIIKETQPMGTCGALNLLPQKEFQKPFFVMNGDLLTNINFSHLLDYHEESSSIATICVKEEFIEVPFGVVEMDHHYLKRIVEKPQLPRYINAGIYAFNPGIFKYIPNTRYDMNELFEKVIASGKKVACFPIREFWIDVGNKKNYKKAQHEYRSNFKQS